MRHIVQIFVLLGLLYHHSAGAEIGSDFGDPTGGNTVTSENPEFTSGNAANIAGGFYADPNSVAYDQQNDGSGREYKAQSAADDSQAGSGAAAAAGAALIASGVPMLANPLTMPTGITLITMGGIELAQSGASAGAQDQNQDQENLLTYDPSRGEGEKKAANSGSNTAAQRAATAARVNTPELQEFLTNQGVNSDAFIDDLLNGGLTNFDSVANALNIPNDFSQDQIAKAEQTALGTFNNMKDDTKDLGYDESRDSFFTGDSEGAAAGKQGDLASNDLPRENGRAVVEGSAMVNRKLTDSQIAEGIDAKGLFNHFMKKGRRPAGKNRLANMPAHRLRQMGLFKGTKKTNIFVKARRSFRSFGRWRNSSNENKPAAQTSKKTGIRTAQVR